MADARLDWSGPSVQAVVNYIDPDVADPGGINDADREDSTLKLVSRQVRIHDLRPIQGRLDLEANGFTVLARPTRLSDPWNGQEVREVYFPEVEALVRELTGADLVRAFGPVLRDGSRSDSRHLPVFNAHVDYDVPTIRAVAATLLPPEDLERRLAGRIVLINVWRPLAPVESHPLALCDPSSVAREDLVYGPIGGKSASGVANAAGYNLAPNAGHRWCYARGMQPDEALVFKQCDTDQSRLQWTGHTAFDDPTSPAGAQPRKSLEVRTLAFLPA